MATINPVTADVVGLSGLDAQTVTWTGITASTDTVNPYSRMDLGDRTIQVTGNFNGGTVELVGSNDGTNYFVLTNPVGTSIQFTAAGLFQVTEAVLYIKPVMLSGSGASITAVLAARRTMRGG